MEKSPIDYSCFVFCPKCGARMLRPQPPYAYHCDACGFTFYMNIAAAAAAIIIDEQNRLLVATRAKDPAKGTLDLPGGFVNPDETAEEAIGREVREELNLEVVETMYLFSIPNEYPYGGVLYHTLDMVYRCRVDGFTELKAADDVTAVQWIAVRQLEPDKFGLKSVREIIKRVIASA
ncbi:MAG: NUDIX hydrolase [Planctomycetes bacterium]|nr:NUDIX hydrolase [Planctomycetota bacterium]